MAKLFGKTYSKKDLLRQVGDISQICGAQMIELVEGRSRGVRIVRCWTGSGLEFDIVTDRGMGIGAFRYKGIPLAWMSSTGEVAPAYYEPEAGGMDRSYAGGLMHNSGLRNVGAPCEDAGELLGLHGRISNLPAENVSVDGYWDKDEYYLRVTGTVRETTALGENLILRRTISTGIGSREITIEDAVENAGPKSTPFMILYHTNFGFPLIQGGTRLVIPTKRVTDPNTGEVLDSDSYKIFNEASDAETARIYIHELREFDGYSGYVISNEKIGLGIRVSYLKENLNRLVQWVNQEAGRNVVEVGPSNCSCLGRAAEREAGTLQSLEPGELRRFHMMFKVLDGEEHIRSAEQQYSF
jgi:hypothetical protein